jgi:hypothetical protein
MPQRIRLALLSFWLGALAFFTTSVAQAAFAVLPTRRMAGDLVAPILMNLEYVGLGMSIVLIVALLLSGEGRTRRWFIELGLYIAAFIATAIARFVVAARIHDLRAQFGDQLDTLAQTDPVRAWFGQLHGISVGLMGLVMLLVLVVLVLLILQGRQRH